MDRQNAMCAGLLLITRAHVQAVDEGDGRWVVGTVHAMW
jgi:hypothetical protein